MPRAWKSKAHWQYVKGSGVMGECPVCRVKGFVHKVKLPFTFQEMTRTTHVVWDKAMKKHKGRTCFGDTFDPEKVGRTMHKLADGAKNPDTYWKDLKTWSEIEEADKLAFHYENEALELTLKMQKAQGQLRLLEYVSDSSKVVFHTEIRNPDAMSTLDTALPGLILEEFGYPTKEDPEQGGLTKDVQN